MPERTDQAPDQPSLTPQPNRIMSEPATPEACQQDYADAADVRSRLGWKDAS